MIELGAYITKRKSIVVTALNNSEAILLNLKNQSFYALNRTGLRIWHFIDGKRTVKNIIEAMFREYNIDKTILSKNVLRQIEEFVKEGLVEIKNRRQLLRNFKRIKDSIKK